MAIYTDANGWTQAEYDRKIEWTSDMLSCLRADVFGFQELWHGDCLTDAFTKAGLINDYDLIVPPSANGAKIVCAAAARKGLLEGQPNWIEKFPDKFRLESKGDDPQTPAIAVTCRASAARCSTSRPRRIRTRRRSMPMSAI